jgi:uncharacterized small protein (DUF1192 family)
MSSQPENKPNQQQPEALPRREEFQKYLEKEGVIEELTKLFVYLYESDRPDNALDYVRQFFNSNAPSNNDADPTKLQAKIDELEKKLSEKDAEIARLKAQLGVNDNKDNNNNNNNNGNDASNDNADVSK